MTDTTIYYRFVCRRDTAANWVTFGDDVLKQGEWGVEWDTGKAKLGDGMTPYRALPYAVPGSVDLTGLVDGARLKWDAGAGQWVVDAPAAAVDLSIGVIGAVFDGGGTDIPVGTECEVYVPYGFEITDWRTLALSGTVSAWKVDVRVSNFAAYPPGAGNSIVGASTPVEIAAGADKAASSALTGWTTAFVAGQVVRFVVAAAGGVSKASVELIVRKV